MPSPLTYPYARGSAGQVVAAAHADRLDHYRCLGCEAPMVPRQGHMRRAHFAHTRSSAPACAPETVLHRLGKALIKQGLEAACAEHHPYPLAWTCCVCGWACQGDLARTADRRVLLEPVLGSVRPDLLVVAADERPLAAIEVIVTHEPEPAALEEYRRRRLPVVLVNPTWDSLKSLHSGLVEVGARVLHGPCSAPRHPPPPDSVPPCRRCGHSPRLVALDVWRGLRCCRCRTVLSVLDVWWPDQAANDPYTCRAPVSRFGLGLVAPAQALGVRLGKRSSRAAGGRSLVQLCPSCGAHQGDGPLYRERSADWSPSPEHPVRVAFYAWCERCDTWRRLQVRIWP